MTNPEFQRGAIDASTCVDNAWELFKRRPWLYIGAGVIVILLLSCLPFVNIFLVGPVTGGFAYLVLRDMRNEPVDFGMLFKGFEKFVPLMVIGLIQMIPGIIFQVLRFTGNVGSIFSRAGGSDGGSVLGGAFQTGFTVGLVIFFIGYWLFQIIWGMALVFAIPLIVERNVSIGEAIRLSFSAVFANIGGLIVLMLYGALIGLLGVLALCVGIFVAIPVMWAANVFAYTQVFPLRDRFMNMSPPHPSEYGSSFGQGM